MSTQLVYDHFFSYVMVFKNKRPQRNQREARSRARSKNASSKRAQMRSDKFAGVERQEEDFYDSTERGGVESAPLFVRAPIERQVVVGDVPRGQLSQTVGNRTVVRLPALRKGGSESWEKYRERIHADAGVQSLKVAKQRNQAGALRQEYESELHEILVEYLHLTVLPTLRAPPGSSRARYKFVSNVQSSIPLGSCRVVNGVESYPFVVFPYRYVKVSIPPSQLSEHWPDLFASERADALRKRDQPVGSQVPLEDVPVATYQGFGALSFDVPGLDVMLGWVRSHSGECVALLAELRALSLVKVGKRREYMLARATSHVAANWDAYKVMCMDGADTAFSVAAFITVILDIPAVTMFFNKLTGTSPPKKYKPSDSDDDDDIDPDAGFLDADGKFHKYSELGEGARPIPVAVAQGFIQDALAYIPRGLSPGTALHSLIALFMAIFALVESRKTKVPLAQVGTLVAKQVVGLPSVDTLPDVVAALARHLPSAIAGVSAAIAGCSLLPLFKGKGDVFIRFSRLSASYDLHKQGFYPNSNHPDVGSFMYELDSVYAEMQPMVRGKDASVLRAWQQLENMRTAVSHDIMGKWREAPYALAIVGASKIGKSDILAKIIGRLTRLRFGEPATPDRIYTMQSHDAYASGYKMSHQVLIMDDVCNAKASAGTPAPNPLRPIIELVNNITTPLNMAACEDKGRLAFVSPFMFATSNVEDLHAATYSNEPVSVLRRFDLFVIPTVRPQYREAGTDMLDPTKVPDIPLPDLWSFKLRYAVSCTDKSRHFLWRDVPFPEEATILDLFVLLEGRMTAHFARQAALAAGQTERKYLLYTDAELRLQMANVLRAAEARDQPDVMAPEAVAQGLPPLVLGAVNRLSGVQAWMLDRWTIARPYCDPTPWVAGAVKS